MNKVADGGFEIVRYVNNLCDIINESGQCTAKFLRT